jgi:type IV pilus assembly protein PilA
MAVNWYYADSQNQQQGPVAAAWLADAFRSKLVQQTTLVWREGLNAWVPLRQVALELGVPEAAFGSPVLAPGPAVRTTAGGAANIVRPESSRGWIVALVIGLGGLIVVVAILAAIAIPAYQDYVVRAKVSVAFVEADAQKAAVAEFYAAQGRCPTNGDEGFKPAQDYATPMVSAIHIRPSDSGDCGIELILSNLGGSAVANKTLRYSMDAKGKWTRSSDLPARYLPQSMR